MPSLILNVALAASMFAAQKFATDSMAQGPFSGSFGYSSEEMGGGGGAYLGVDTRDVTSDRLGELQLKEERGVEVTMVDQDAPAGKVGLKEHDVILTINETSIESVEQLRRVIHEIPPGRTVNIGISRNGQPMTLKAQLADRKMKFAMVSPGNNFKFEMPPMPMVADLVDMPSVVMVHSSTRSGLMVENMTPQLGLFFGAKDGHGVLVRSVEKGSAAEKAGFRAGDVIVRVNGQAVSDTGDFTHTLRSGKENTVSVSIIRDKKEQNVTLTLPERKHSELQDESFELPEIDAETKAALDQVKVEIAAVKPEITLYVEQIKKLKPEIEKQVKGQHELIRENVRKMQKDMLEQKEECRKVIKDLVITGGADI